MRLTPVMLCLQARLTGMPTDGGDGAVQAAAAALQARGVANVLVKLGKHGSMLVPPPPALPLRQPALRAEKVRLCGQDACKYAAHVFLPWLRWLTPRARVIALRRLSAWP
jgi:hypothetical protein